MDNNKIVFFPEDISKITGLGLNLIYRLLRAGEICYVKAGDRYLISRVNFEKWLNGNHEKTITPDKKGVPSDNDSLPDYSAVDKR